jgi:hypothetical protein
LQLGLVGLVHGVDGEQHARAADEPELNPVARSTSPRR